MKFTTVFTCILSFSLASLGVVAAQPKHLPHMVMHEKKDAAFLYTELVLSTVVECATTTVTLPSGFVPSSSADTCNTAPPAQTKIIPPAVNPTTTSTTSSTILSTTSSYIAPVANKEAAYSPDLSSTVQGAAIPTTTASSIYSTGSSTVAGATDGGGSVGGSGPFVNPTGGVATSQCGKGAPCSGPLTVFDTTNTMFCGYTPVTPDMMVIALPAALMGSSSNLGANLPLDGNCNRGVSITIFGKTLHSLRRRQM